MVQGDIDKVPDVCFVPSLIKAVIVCQEAINNLAALAILKLNYRQQEPLSFQLPADTPFVIAVLLSVFLIVVLPYIGDIFQKQHHKDIILILRRVHHSPEGIARRPCCGIDLTLGNLVCHFFSLIVADFIKTASYNFLRLFESSFKIASSLFINSANATIFFWPSSDGASTTRSPRSAILIIRTDVPPALDSSCFCAAGGL